jgi:hypothetical protein
MNRLPALLLVALLAPPQDPPAPAPEPPAPVPAPAPAGGGAAPAAPAPPATPAGDAEDAAAQEARRLALEAADREARDLLRKAAKRQGSEALVGEKGVRRFRVRLDPIEVHTSKGDRYQTASTESFAEPSKVRSDATVEGRRTVLGHSGRQAWIWRDKGGAEALTDPEGRHEGDARDIEQRRRFLRIVRGTFFLGALAGEPGAPLLRHPERKYAVPDAQGEPRAATVIPVERAGSSTEPGLVLLLDAKTLDLVAAELLPVPGSAAPRHLLTFQYAEGAPDPARVPKGLRLPDWMELFELPAEAGAKPRVLVRAGLKSLEIDAAKIPDEEFRMPATKDAVPPEYR